MIEPMPLSFAGVIHYPRLKDRLATHFVPFAEFEKDAAAGTLPDFSLIEPNMLTGHGDYHPAAGPVVARRRRRHRDRPAVVDPGRRGVPGARLQHLPLGHLGVGHQRLEHGPADRVGRAGRNLRPRRPRARSRRPIPAAPAGEFGFTFDRSGYRVPAIMVSPWVESGLGVQRGVPPHLADRDAAKDAGISATAFTQRDAPARTFDHVFTRETPRDPDTWVAVEAQPVPDWAMDYEVLGKALSDLGKAAGTRPDREGTSHGSHTPTRTRRPRRPNSPRS